MIKVKVTDNSGIDESKEGFNAISEEFNAISEELDRKLDKAATLAMTAIDSADEKFVAMEGEWYIDE